MEKEILEKLERIYNQADSFGKSIMEKEFPELTKSKDEWLIEEILYIVKNYRESCIDEGHHKFDDCIAWLEKQKKRNGLTKDEEFTLNRIIEHFEEEGGYDKWIEVLQDIRNIPYQKEQKPTLSEEDERMFDSIIEDVMPCGEWPDYPTDEEGEYFYEGYRKVRWLKSLKERIKK